MSIIKDTFFGGAEKKAAKASVKGVEKGIEATERATEEARAAAIPLFGQARQDLQQGFQGALDVFGQSLPAQIQAFQGGNVGAQEQLLAGLPQFQNAILGNQVDFSQLQPVQVQTPDLSFFQQQLPGTTPTAPVTPAGPTFDGGFGPSVSPTNPAQNTGGFFNNLASQQGTGGFFDNLVNQQNAFQGRIDSTEERRANAFDQALALVNSGQQPSREQVAALRGGRGF